MIDNYKNILANKFMRDTNYIIIKDTDDLEELERQWELFNSYLTVRQQRLSDDRSIEIWDMTNKQHYEALKSELIKDIEIELSDDEDNIVYSYEDDNEEEISEDDIDNSFELPDDENNITEPFEESIIPISNNPAKSQESSINTNQDLEKDNMADQYEIDTNINIIGTIKGKDSKEYLANLEKSFKKWNSQNQDHRKKSDDKCREIYGMSNIDRYKKLKGEALKNEEFPKDNKKIKAEDLNNTKPLGEFVSEVYNNLKVVNEVEKIKFNQHRRFNDTPYFTPSELIDMGVHGNHNFYSKQADNDGLITNVKIPTWFDSYKDMCMDHIFEDYRKDWIDTMSYLYSDFEDIKASGDEEKILARKQSILDLGWNPEIPFNRKNRLKASKRVSRILDETIPKDIFIKLDDIDISDEDDMIEESVNKKTHKPVLLIFTQGKTPIVSQGIKFFTGSSYSHASISFDPELNEVYSYNMREENFGFIRENLSSFKDNIISVMAFFAPNHIVESLKDKIKDFENNKTTFDLRIFLNKILHIDHKVSKNEYNQVCSTFVDTVLRSGGINLTGNIEIPDPGQLYTATKNSPNKIIEVYQGIATEYNGKAIKRKLDALYNKNINDILESVSSLKYFKNYLIETSLPIGVTLRPATKDDSDNMFKWRMESIDKRIRNDPKVIKFMEKDVQDSIKITKMIMYNGETIGMFITDRLKPGSDYWYIGEIYIVKEHRNKGIGTALLKDEISKHDKLILQVAQSNHGAIKLYKSLGFEITDRNDEGKLYVMTLDKTKKPIKESVLDDETMEEVTTCRFVKAARHAADKINLKASAAAASTLSKLSKDKKKKEEYRKLAYTFRSMEDLTNFDENKESINDYLQEGNIRNTIGRKLNNIDVKVNKVNDIVFDKTDSIIKQSKEEYKDSKVKKTIAITTAIIGLPPIISIPGLIAIKNWEKIVKLRKSMIATSIKERRKINSDADFTTNFVRHGIISAVVSASVGKIIDKITDIIDKDKNKYHTPEPSIGYTKNDKPILLRYYENRVLPIEVYAKLNEEGRPKEEIDSIIFSPYNLRPYSSKSLPENYILYQVAYCDDKYNVILVVEDLDRVKKYLEEQGETLDSYLEKGKTYKFTISNKYCTIPEEHNIYDIKEQASILNEVKQFPIEFDKEGNLIIYKSRIGSLAFGDEIDDSVQLLQVYRNSSNIEGMKYELAKLWYINDCIEKKLKKRLSNDEYKELIDTRATCLNVFKTNLDYVMKTEKGFNFSDYYNSTPFSDNSVKITANTLKYTAKTITGMI